MEPAERIALIHDIRAAARARPRPCYVLVVLPADDDPCHDALVRVSWISDTWSYVLYAVARHSIDDSVSAVSAGEELDALVLRGHVRSIVE
jgi:hypothetical protein